MVIRALKRKMKHRNRKERASEKEKECIVGSVLKHLIKAVW